MRTLITGAGGFVGANLAHRMIASGHDVHVLLRPGSVPWRLDGAAVQRHHADLRDAAATTAAVDAAKPQWVFHCAAYGGYSWQTDAVQIRATNVDGTANLLDACRRAGVAVFVNTGSSSEYGFKDHAPSESEIPEPNSPYALSKLWATEYCAYHARVHGGAVVTLRLYSVYGPYEEPGRLMPTLVTLAAEGLLPPLADAATARDFVYIDDVCDAYVAAAEHPPCEPGCVLNVGTGAQSTLRDVVALVREMFDVGAEPVWSSLAARAWDTSTWRADATRIRSQLGWRPRHSLADGVAAFRAWLAEHPEVAARYRRAAPRAASSGAVQ